ncbi:LysR family transcriptional regulator [Pseudomonas entomophila]|uniref:LysR family transcriptional regulator n=1 Tax=Pseudomonas entomophila TaxID=312306 RepID=UPI0023D7C7F5|nr:LysR family transcriptional regulator [Pseudomonas entomophila]MDF0733093.1 LysR family transcriptional regulator [Pseudomonas entomophila]
MELRHLRYFKVLAETLNFTRAAELLHMAQPPLSRQISQLEDQLGTLLVLRERPLRLTEAGRFFYEQTCTVLRQLEQISDNTRRIGQGQRQWLGIGFAPSTLYGVLPALIRELRRDAELQLGLNEMTTVQQVEALKSGRIDIAFGRIRIEDAAIVQQVLYEDPLVAVLPAGHPLAGTALALEQLADEPFVLYPANPRPSYADHILALFAHHGLSVRVSQWTNELQTALGLVAAGLGVTLAPASVQQQHRPDIAYADVRDPGAVSPIILSRRLGDLSPRVQRCLGLIETLSACVPGTRPATG